MPTFTYNARDESGRLIKGVLEAESKVVVADRLRTMGYLVTRMEEMGAATIQLPDVLFRPSASQEEILLMAIQLSNLVEAGIPLLSALQGIATQTGQGPLREALEAVVREVEGGNTLSAGLSHHPGVFPKLMPSLAAVGEASGKLDLVLNRFAGLIEKEMTLKRTVQGALLYPVFLFATSLSLVLFVVTFVVPQFAALFAKAGIPLPVPTQMMFAVGMSIRTHWILLLFGLAAGLMGLGMLPRLPAVRARLDRVLLKLPLVGPILHQTYVARFSRTLGTLVGAGLPILKALETTEGTIGNQVILKEVQRVRMAVERGERMAATLSTGSVFYPDAIQMIAVGEESGRLDGMLEKVADFYELRVNYSVKKMTTLLEPILLVVMGGIVALIMASLLLPLFDMVKVLQKGGMR